MWVPHGFRAWLARLLEKNPSLRYRWAADAAHALMRIGASGDWLGPKPHAAPSHPEPVSFSLQSLVGLDTHDTLRSPSRAGPLADAVAPTKGLEAPIARLTVPTSWRRTDESPRQAPPVDASLALFGLRTVPVIGRDDLRDALWAQFARVQHSGRARFVLLEGPAGCGKSHLVRWLTRRAHEVGAASVLSAVHAPAAAPADALVQMVRRYLRCEGLSARDTTERIARLAQTGAFGPGEGPSALEALLCQGLEGSAGVRIERAGERHAITRWFVERVCARRTAVLWFEDAHWGPDTLDFARDLLDAQSTAPCPALLIATARSDAREARPDVTRRLDALCGDEAGVRLWVGPLREDARAEFVRALLPLSPTWTAEVAARSGGVPLYAVQLLDAWIRRGDLVAGSDGFRPRPGAVEAWPNDLDAVWTARVDEVLAGRAEDDARALELAAIVGPEVDTGEWTEVCEAAGICAPDGFDGLVAALLSRGLAERISGAPGDPRGHWKFVHGMLAESLVRRAAGLDRLRDHHRVCATVLSHRGRNWAAERVAPHFEAAGEINRAADEWARAIALRIDRGEYDAAADLSQRNEAALRAARVPPEDERWGTGWVLGARRSRLTGDLPSAAHLAEQTEAAALRYGWRDAAAEAMLERGIAIRSTDTCGELASASSERRPPPTDPRPPRCERASSCR